MANCTKAQIDIQSQQYAGCLSHEPSLVALKKVACPPWLVDSKNNNKAESFFDSIFMSTLMWITEQEQEIKSKGRQISLEEKHENFIARAEKMRNASGHQGENEWQWKKKWTGTHTNIQHFLYKMCNKEVLCCSRAKQQQRNVQKSVLHVQSCFFANQTY